MTAPNPEGDCADCGLPKSQHHHSGDAYGVCGSFRAPNPERDVVLVPREPTEAMLQGACDKHVPGQPMSENRPEECPRFATRRRIWSKMIEAAPAALQPSPAGPSGDHPDLDGTDAAHPAWWRGQEQAVAVFCQKIGEILDGKDAGLGVAGEPWESTRRRLLAALPPVSGGGLGAVAQGALLPTEIEADDAASFLTRVSEVPTADIDLEYLAVNVLYGRGAMAKETKREAVVAIKTLRAILADARRLTGAA